MVNLTLSNKAHTFAAERKGEIKYGFPGEQKQMLMQRISYPYPNDPNNPSKYE